ncbi:hypothetical protein RAH32_08180 [Paracoccus sp. WLY502]|uniref:hypothetical protein n=1 Tax=Paracoccus yibinensis TaxID=3068891 RepID=UPI0027968401|nr:hypothetical protein [Paracoccus sp. WLY502]MDQ1900422.1 hypothetical protein [Paracoccus sp. WLY502]
MVLGILKPVLNPLLSPAASNAASESSVARSAAEAQAAAQQAATQPGVDQSEGVVFDLSDKALQQVEEAAAAQSAASASPAQDAAAQTPVTSAGASSGAARGASMTDKPAEEKAAPVVSRELAPSDPSEEERARAWAIRGMERGKLLDLVERLKVTPQADPAEKEVAEHTAAQPFVQAAPDRKDDA